MIRNCSLFGSCVVFLTLVGPNVLADDSIDFNREVRPILAQHCVACHGPDEAAREAELRLDIDDKQIGALADRESGQAVVPGDLNNSLLWQRINSQDDDLVMPPLSDEHPRLKASEIGTLKRWILSGGNFQQHWAFVAARPQAAPSPITAWESNSLDTFVLAALQRNGKSPSEFADKRTLIRRLTLDLTGLPPSREEIRRFLEDPSENAYELLVDRLLASPAYGEHMARYWLDLVRFADTNGIHHDHYREMTPYRDWVIRAFNDNLSFDRFVTYQIAGDLYPAPTQDQLVASGFNRLHLVIDRGTAIPQESFTRNVIDRVNAFGTAFLGLTVGCAVCHDHKYDPITQKDFYQLYAFFNNIDSEPETPGRNTHAPFLRLPSQRQSVELASLEAEVDQLNNDKAELATRAKSVQEKLASEPDEATKKALGRQEDEFEAELKKLEEELKSANKRKANFEKTIPVSLIMKERKEIRPAHILIRGVYDQLGAQVERGTPAFLPPIKNESSAKSRMDLAQWLLDPEHPLTARVAVNRIWQQFFGVGLVKTSEDFGTQGEMPSHPALLDHLSTQFVASNWDVKELIRQIVLSSTYRQSSKATPSDYEADVENRMLARGSRFRLDAEIIRDQILLTAGTLNGNMFGKSVKPPQPPNLWKNVSMVSSSTYAFEADQGEKIHRRSVYSFWKRALPPPQMTIFDAPTREACIARRERTNTPLQALVLMNETRYFEATRILARRLVDFTPDTLKRLQIAFESITSHIPTERELKLLSTSQETLQSTYLQNPEAVKELLNLSSEAVPTQQDVEIAAFTMIVNAIYNLDRVKTRE